MIQRRQSLYLLAITIIGLVLLFMDLKYAVFQSTEDQKSAILGYTTTRITTGENVSSVVKWINALILIFITLGSFTAIFLFKKSELQKKLCIYVTLLGALLILLMVMDYNSMKNQLTNVDTYPGIWSVFPLFIIVFGFLSWRGIRKDEKLIKSMDRIR